MSAAVVIGRIAETSPRFKARIAGALWLVCIATSVFSFVIGSRLIVASDAAATATNILANESSFRLGFVADLLSGMSYVGVTVLLYSLLRPVSRSLSLLAAFFGLAGVAIGGMAWLSHLVPLVLLRGDPYLSAFTTAQLQALSLLALKLQLNVFSIGMVFFGVQCFVAGYLIARSTFFPRILGVLLAIGGLSYVISSLATFLAPLFGARLTPFIIPVALLGEGSLTLWLLVRGVNAQRWKEQASGAGYSDSQRAMHPRAAREEQ
jgi:Domain of unknown function (DUF4386)